MRLVGNCLLKDIVNEKRFEETVEFVVFDFFCILCSLINTFRKIVVTYFIIYNILREKFSSLSDRDKGFRESAVRGSYWPLELGKITPKEMNFIQA